MNTGQMMLSIGAMLLLSTVMLRVNTTNLTTSSVRDEAQYGVLATSIATSIIEEAKSFAFDEATDSNAVSSLTEITNVGLLGPEPGETKATFDDFDDFNNYTYRDSTMPSAIFDIACNVDYVESSKPLEKANKETWHKKITVKVSSPFMTDTVRQSSIYSYWYFR